MTVRKSERGGRMTILSFNRQQLRIIRENKGLSVTALAALTGVSKSMVSSWELGINKPNHENIQRLADALKVKVEAIQS